jgi:membrane peptidoglycan carboxypeptidase
LSGEKDVYYLDSGEIPFLVKTAIISVEDRDFYEHEGVDYKAVLRAFWALIENSVKLPRVEVLSPSSWPKIFF